MRNKIKRYFAGLFFGMIILIGRSSYATNYDWTLTSGTGDWDDSSNWNDGSGSYPQSSADTATFGSSITGSITVNVSSSFAVDQVIFDTDQVVNLNDSGSGGLTLGGGSSSYQLSTIGSGSYNISVPLSLVGSGDAILSNGTMTITDSSILPSAMAFVITTPATLDLGTTTQTIASLSDGGGTGGTIILGTESFAGTLTLGDSSDTSFSGIINGFDSGNQSNITKQGSGTFTFSGEGSFSMSLNAGSYYSNGLSVGNISAATSTTVGGNGEVSGLITLSSGSMLNPGSSADAAGTLILLEGRNVTFNSGSTYLVTVNSDVVSNVLISNNTTLTGDLEFSFPTDFNTGSLTSSFPILVMTDGSVYTGTFNAPTYPSGYIINVNYLENTSIFMDISTFWEWNVDSSGTWTTSSNWAPNNGDYPDTTFVTAAFEDILTSASTITIPSAISVNQLTFDTTNGFGYTLSGTGPLTLGGTQSEISFSGNAEHIIDVPLVLSEDVTISQESSLVPTISGDISGTGNMSLSVGSLILSGSNTYTGTTTISAEAELFAESSSALSSDSDIVLEGTLTVTDGGTVTGVISGTGTLDLTGGTLTLSGVNTLEGTVEITGGTLVSSVDDALPTNSLYLVESGGTLAIGATSQDIAFLTGSGLVTIGSNGNLTVGSSSSGVFSGTVTGSDSSSILTKNTTNSFFFTGTSSIPGGLVVDEGTFFVNTDNWAAPIDVMSGATLGGIGTISGNCFLDNGGIIAPGNGTIPGTLTFSPNSTVVFLGNKSTYSAEIASTGASKLILTADTTLNGIVAITVLQHFVPSSKPYTIIEMEDGSSYQGQFDTLSISKAYYAELIYRPTTVLVTFSVSPISNQLLSKLSGNQKVLADYINQFSTQLVYVNTLGLSELESALNTISTARNYASAYALQNSAFAFSSQLSSHISDKRFFHYLGKNHEGKEAVNLMQALSKKMSHVREVADLMNEFAVEETSETVSETVEEKPISSFQLWATGFGQFGHQDKTAQGQNPAFNFTAEGTLVGFDYDLMNGQVGGAVGYAHDHIAMEHQFGSNQANSVIASMYGSYFEGDFFCDLSLLTSVSFFKNDRHVFFPGFDEHAKSSYTGWMIDPHFGCGYHFDFDWSALEPYFSVDAAIVFEEKYSETGATPFNFTQKSRSSEMLRSEVGLSAYQETNAGEDGIVLFKESISYVSKVLWGSMQSAFVGTSSGISLVTTPGTQNLFSPKFEALYKWNEFTFSVIYEGEFGSGYTGNEIFGKFNYEF